MLPYLMIILDSSIVIQILRCNVGKLPLLFRDGSTVIILMDTVLSEVQKVYWFKKQKNLSYADIMEKMIFFGASVSISPTNKKMEEYAKIIENKYDICHYPDSLILAAAKFYGTTIVTLDKNMLKVAKQENILTYDLKKLKDLKNLV